ncbi:T9SS type A sorting domain-containing protein [Winogradskyella wandonensis]|nr:T9SS type A sorting domain-containing protein [Winogradskyella wandonensis]
MKRNYIKKALFLLVCLFNFLGHSQELDTTDSSRISINGPVCEMPKTTDIDNKIFIPRPEFVKERMNNTSERTSCSTFIVNYSGFPLGSPERDAFQFAVDIWENLLASNVPIRVNATFAPAANSSNLGSASPAYYREVPGLTNPNAQVLYPAALYEKLTGVDGDGISGESIDINCNFNSNRSDWYFGTDGNTPSGQFDFVTVVLHELGHGLGVAGFGIENPTGQGRIRRDASGFTISASSNHVSIWDTFIQARAPGFPITNEPVIDENEFADPSTTLFNAFRGGANSTLSCFSPSVVQEYGEAARTYAPGTFNPGSSYSHWDEVEFNNTPNALMTPFAAPAEAIHDPGPITLAFMEDMGWERCQSLSTNDFALEDIKISPNPFRESLTINLSTQLSNQEFNISIIDINGRIVVNDKVSSGSEITINNLSGLEKGLFFLTIESKSSDLRITKKIIKQ